MNTQTASVGTLMVSTGTYMAATVLSGPKKSFSGSLQPFHGLFKGKQEWDFLAPI
jgi:hypothetical protein